MINELLPGRWDSAWITRIGHCGHTWAHWWFRTTGNRSIVDGSEPLGTEGLFSLLKVVPNRFAKRSCVAGKPVPAGGSPVGGPRGPNRVSSEP